MATVNKSAGDGSASDSALQTGSTGFPLPEGGLSFSGFRSGALPAIPMRAGDIPVETLINLYMAHYAGRDTTRPQRLSWWAGHIGHLALQDVTDDHVHAALEDLSQCRATYHAGLDAAGKPIYKAKRKAIAPATINRYNASIAAVFTWAIKRRVAPKGWIHPCRSVERRAEHNEQTPRPGPTSSSSAVHLAERRMVRPDDGDFSPAGSVAWRSRQPSASTGLSVFAAGRPRAP